MPRWLNTKPCYSMTEKQTVLTKIVLIAMVASIVQLVLPWWSIAIAAFGIEQIGKNRPSYSFYAGFYGIALVWIPYMFYIDHKNSHILSHRICKLFSLPEYPILLMLVAALVGGGIAGLAALSGNYFKSLFTKNEVA